MYAYVVVNKFDEVIRRRTFRSVIPFHIDTSATRVTSINFDNVARNTRYFLISLLHMWELRSKEE